MTSKKTSKASKPVKIDGILFKVSRRNGLMQKVGRHWQKVAPFIRVTGLAHEEGDKRYLVRIKFRTLDGNIAKEFLPRQDVDAARVVVGRLLDAGFKVPSLKSKKEALLSYLGKALPPRRFVIVNRSGWYEGVYILANGELIGSPGKVQIEYRPQEQNPDHRPLDVLGGTLAGWQEGVAEPARHSHRMMFAIAVGFSSMLLNLTDVESGLFHFFGASSKGKTISLLAALSVFQQALKTTVISWDITANAMEEIAAEYCDRLLALDEAGLLFGTDPRKGLQAARDIAFKLTAGAGRRRSRFFTKGARSTSWSWRLMVVSSGEHSFGEMAAKTGAERLGGENVRVIDVPAVMSETWGVFHQVPPDKTSADLAAQVEAAAQAHFGHPGRTFATALTSALEQDRSAVIAQINNLRAEFVEMAQVPRDSWEQRFASRFGLAYAAACMAIRAKIVPWSNEEALAATVDTYQAARRAIPKFDNVIERAWGRVCDKLKASKRVIDLTTVSGRKLAKLGAASVYLKFDAKLGRYYVVSPEALRRWAGDGVSLTCLGPWMREQGHLVTTNRNLPTRQVKVPGVNGRCTYYCIRAKAVDAG